jgi:predicted MFS family arabinose efflux permease
VLTATAPDFSWLLPGRLLAGVGSAFILPNCIAAAADLFVDPARRNRAVSTVWAATSVAVLLGLPVLTQIESWIGWRWAAASILLPLGLLLLGTVGLPRRATLAAVSAVSSGQTVVWRHQRTVWLMAAVMVFWLVFFGSFAYLGAFASTEFDVDANSLSLIFLIGGIADLVGTYLTANLIRWRSASILFAVATVAYAANLVAIDLVYTELWMLYGYMAIAGFSSGVASVAGSVLLLDSLPSARGALMALQSASISLGGALGTAIAGGLLATGGYRLAYTGLGLLLFSAPLLLVMANRQPSREATTDELAIGHGSMSPVQPKD